MSPFHKKIVWLTELLKSPPLSDNARIETGFLLRQLQAGISLGMPHSRPMPSIGKGCHELRVNDDRMTWRFFYRIDDDAIILLHWVSKKTQQTAKKDISICKARLQQYDADGGKDEKRKTKKA
ncbi:MAG: type II toxin-antitoxin system RelE/ParE family toxin [Candidatus Electrothrix sp. MAN1_4]|nr:type II toxin-antitoxin system RelE/ParE family toxin [Candidatus Electrothrix sp. MAN1_4]